jgi:transposase
LIRTDGAPAAVQGDRLGAAEDKVDAATSAQLLRTDLLPEPLIDWIDGEMRQHVKAGPRVKILTTLPGVGHFTALVMLTEIGDITRFPTARQLASWAGLTPTVRGSHRTVRHGHISKQGLGLAALGAEPGGPIRQGSPEFTATYVAIANRRGTKIATIAISRKLLTRAWHLLATAALGPVRRYCRRPGAARLLRVLIVSHHPP